MSTMVATRRKATKARKAAPRTARISLARFVDLASGEVPSAFRILASGENTTDKGPLVFTPRSARLVMDAWEARGNPLALYYEHEDQLPLEKRGGAPMRGVCAAPSARLALRGPDNAPELWAEDVAWTDEAKRQIKTGERRQISPVAAFDKDTREVIEILNVSLCGEGATHNGTLLASRGGERSSNVDELMQKLQDAISAADWETAEDVINEIERAEAGGEDMAKMARACVRAAKMAAPPPPKPDDTPDSGRGDVAEKRLAATRARFEQEQAFSRGMAKLERATEDAKNAARQSRKATVQTLIAANRDLFDPADEREHMTLADPEATQRHIASLIRKRTAGLLVASRGDADKPEAKPPKDAHAKKPEDELTEADKRAIEQFNRNKPKEKQMTAEEYLATKRRHDVTPPANATGGRA